MRLIDLPVLVPPDLRHVGSALLCVPRCVFGAFSVLVHGASVVFL